MLWGQGARIRRARSKAPFTTAVAVALGVVFAGGLLLAVVGLRVHADLGEVLRGHASLSAGDARAAFLHTLRPIVDVRGQRVDATDRMYLAQSIPFMIVWGERDPIIPVAHGRAAHERVPGSRLEVFPDAGHFPHLDDPLRFIRVMIDFVQTSPPARVDAGRWGEATTQRLPLARLSPPGGGAERTATRLDTGGRIGAGPVDSVGGDSACRTLDVREKVLLASRNHARVRRQRSAACMHARHRSLRKSINPALRSDARSGLSTRSQELHDYALKRMTSRSSRSRFG